jgi:hypothetical protein
VKEIPPGVFPHRRPFHHRSGPHLRDRLTVAKGGNCEFPRPSGCPIRAPLGWDVYPSLTECSISRFRGVGIARTRESLPPLPPDTRSRKRAPACTASVSPITSPPSSRPLSWSRAKLRVRPRPTRQERWYLRSVSAAQKEKAGRVRFFHVPYGKRATLEPIIKEHTLPDGLTASILISARSMTLRYTKHLTPGTAPSITRCRGLFPVPHEHRGILEYVLSGKPDRIKVRLPQH